MKDHVHMFYQNEPQREAVKAYMLAVMDREALKVVYKGGNTASIAEARKIVKDTFTKMNIDYKEQDKPLTGNKSR